MKNILSKLLALMILAFFLATIAPARVANASFNKNSIIDDFVFNNYSSMTVSQIDSFLNSFPSSCISTNKGFKAPDPTGYSPSTSYTYGGAVSAGTIIYNAAQAYKLNPRVILATLQKEQSLVSGTAGCSKLRYVGAMGNGCPDGGKTYNYSGFELYRINSTVVTSVTGTCVNTAKAAGFARQIITATWKLKFFQQRALGNVGWAEIHGSWDNSDDPPSCYYGYMTTGYRYRSASSGSCHQYVYYDGNYTIDSTTVHMDTGATAGLYYYTPHLHGNQNFVSIYEAWFGSTRANPIKLTYVTRYSSESGGTAIVEYSLVSQPTANVIIPLLVSDTSEATLSGISSLSIAPANWNKPANNKVIITGVNDSIPDGDIPYTLIAGNPTSNDPAFDNLTSSATPNANLINNDNEPDTAIIGDWNGDGKDDIGLKRGKQYLLNYGHDGSAEAAFIFGYSTDTVLVGDWNGDGKDDIGLKRGSTYYLNYGHDGSADVSFTFGYSTDTALVGDWNGDGKDDIGLKRGKVYYINYGHNNKTDASFSFGVPSDIPLVGDWNGDHKSDIGLKRNHTYFLNYGHDGQAEAAFNYGFDADIPLVGDWNGDHKSDIGLRRGNQYFLNYGHDGRTETSFNFGYNTDTALVGDWNGDHKSDIGLRRGKIYYLNYGHNNKTDASFSFGR